MSVKLIDMWWCVARLNNSKHTLEIISPGSEEDNCYVPAASVRVYGKTELIALQNALNEAYLGE